MSDEKVNHQRVQMDERRDDSGINNMIKNVIKWSNSTNFSESENKEMYDTLRAQLDEIENNAHCSRMCLRTYEKDLENFKECCSIMSEKVMLTRSFNNAMRTDIETAKERIHYLTNNNHNNSIQDHTSKSELKELLMSLNAFVDELKITCEDIDKKLDGTLEPLTRFLSIASIVLPAFMSIIKEKSINNNEALEPGPVCVRTIVIRISSNSN